MKLISLNGLYAPPFIKGGKKKKRKEKTKFYKTHKTKTFKMKRLILTVAAAVMFFVNARADEGMWLLPWIQKLNYADMKALGLKIPADAIYNSNGTSLKDAIVIFGRGCTGEIVSGEGLLFTNHHCGYGNIQSLSSVENDYLGDGFWAMERSQEIPAPGLTVTFIRSIEDVTDEVLEGIGIDFPETERVALVRERSQAIVARMGELHPGNRVEVNPFFGGNRYFATVSEVYSDVRLVGTPPNSIGKFGGDTDNWMWPRHTGDFAIFRVYAAPDGSPAEYNPENVPLRTPKHLTISARGYNENDFAMIMGFPGSTKRYMTTYEIDEFLDVEAPNRIFIRGERQKLLWEDMEASQKVRIQYASKYARSSNHWKNSIGMSQALRKLGIRDKKQALEGEFAAWTQADPARAHYRKALPLIEESKRESVTTQGYIQYLRETVLTPVEIATLASQATMLMRLELTPEQTIEAVRELYKDYNEPTDRKVTRRMLEILMESELPTEALPAFVENDILGRFGGDLDAYTEWLYGTSIFANEDAFVAALSSGEPLDVAADPAHVIYSTTVAKNRELQGKNDEPRRKFNEGHRLYIAGLMEMQRDAKHYPDANFSMRLTYGQIKPYSPADGVLFHHYTTIEGVIEKEDPSNPLEFTVPDRLKELYRAQDWGRYADFTGLSKKEIRNGAKGQLVVNFISTNDITGGNSGSPVLNAEGHLIGLAFDGNWEAMSGDIVFDNELQRSINVDVRYVLWIVDKFAGAGHLLDEMTIVW
jgi:hypothetical protein